MELECVGRRTCLTILLLRMIINIEGMIYWVEYNRGYEFGYCSCILSLYFYRRVHVEGAKSTEKKVMVNCEWWIYKCSNYTSVYHKPTRNWDKKSGPKFVEHLNFMNSQKNETKKRRCTATSSSNTSNDNISYILFFIIKR